jgi:tetratricopeptide (TPR) repeat protein
MKYWLLLTVLLFSLAGHGQGDPEVLKRLAKELIVHANYEDALATLRQSRELRYQNKEGQLLIALCYYQLNALDEAEMLLERLVEEEETSFPEAYLYLGKIYHARHQFREATPYYKTYLRSIGDNHPSRAVVLDELRRCSNGIRLQYRERKAFVENMGPGINTAGDEFGAVPSPNFGQRIYFSSRRPGNIGGARDQSGKLDERYGQFYSDIYSATNNQGTWGEVAPLHYLLNSPRHEVILGFNSDGSAMYYFQGNEWSDGAIMVDTFHQAERQLLHSNLFLGPVDARVDKAAPHYYDRATVIFPSRRAGGYGGYDLYITTFSQGQWSTPENLGPDINSPYNETTPFLARDGITLYFSSDHPERSIGGYDIFRTIYLADRKRWLPPENMGIPINSAGDDTHFRLAPDGFSAFLTSSRKDGLGQRDLYVAYFDFFLEEQEPPMALEDTYFHQFRPTVTRTLFDDDPSSPPPDTSPAESSFEAPGRTESDAARIAFDDRWEIFEPDNRPLLNQLASSLAEQPSAKLIVEVYTSGGNSVAERLYQAVENGRPVGDFFIARGIGPERILLRGSVHPPGEGTIDKTYALGFYLYNPGQGALPGGEMPFQSKGPDIPTLLYRVKVATLNGIFSGNFMDDFPAPVVEHQMGSRTFHYLSGELLTFDEARNWKQALGKRGMGHAEIIPYIKGWPATEVMIRARLENLPDLKNYLEARSN